jgi:hypothetical protein
MVESTKRGKSGSDSITTSAKEDKKIAATLQGDDIGKLLSEISDDDTEEPDSQELSREEEESANEQDSGDILSDPNILAELGDDPVRLYLKEIGEIDLLETDHEFWLAAQIETARRVDALTRGHHWLVRGARFSAASISPSLMS